MTESKIDFSSEDFDEWSAIEFDDLFAISACIRLKVPAPIIFRALAWASLAAANSAAAAAAFVERISSSNLNETI